MESGLSLQTRRALLQQVIPQYRQASTVKRKSKLLDTFTETTGYNRKYAMWLLNHAKAEHSTPQHIRPRHYGPEVQHALFLAWHAANRISGQTPHPFSPHIGRSGLRGMSTSTSTPECRSQLLSMSAATADRRLAFPAQRRSARSLDDASWNAPKAADSERAPTRSGTRPDLVFWKRNGRAHCGSEIEGGYLYTLTLTDIATGWTECLPLMHRSREAVLAALQRARTLLPFQFLGFDTDNGGEFINEVMVAYCEQEHITFTRGRPYQKRDQCKARAEKWRDCAKGWWVMTAWSENMQARQLTELYRALRRSRQLLQSLQ